MSKEIKEAVKKTYTEVVNSGVGCGCVTSCNSPVQDWSLSESYDAVEGYAEEADYALGCGIPTKDAKIKQGDTVLDLGSGAGNDAFVARSLVGEKGYVIGVDMTVAMIDQANKNNEKLGYQNVEFVLGEIEDLPLEEDSVDVAISNCVLNLVPDKDKAYSEVFRVLKPKGHFNMSDIVLRGNLPTGIQAASEMYAGCISGAMQKEDYLNTIKKAGFKNLLVTKEREIQLPDEVLLQYATPEEVETFKNGTNAIISIGVYAEK